MRNEIVAQNVSIEINGRSLLAKCSFSFAEGDIVLLEGNNGIGKTTLLKAMIGLNDHEVSVQGDIKVGEFDNVVNMQEKELLNLRSNVAYLGQKDEYESYYGITVREVLEDSLEAHKGKLSTADKQFIEEAFTTYLPKNSGISLKSKIRKLSGGQQRIVSILGSLCLRKDAGIFLVDEPLNNLDIKAIVTISNILNRIHIEKPDTLMIIISHCKIFPFVNTTATIANGKIEVSKSGVVCHACFGEPDEKGYYSE
ncbi:MAG: ATP-binding cassette domain-containing protein [Clostridiales bacterium]|nr:ATP-binding cassette domain-containing protein [Clostridiales bacterium]